MGQTITLDLTQFKSSGIYTIEYDQSQNLLVSPQTIRLVVGFSKQGPINTPVFCPDIKTAQLIFGQIDTGLERKLSFFHRALYTCLQTGPVFALNLLLLNNDQTTSPDLSDKLNYQSYSLNTAQSNGVLTPKLVSSFYNQNKFWFPDPLEFLATVSGTGTGPDDWVGDKGKLFHLTNLGNVPMSIIVRKSAVLGYDLTAKAWYAQTTQTQPSFIDDNAYISDYFIDVIAIAGNWTNYTALSIDPVYSQYFDANGIKTSMFDTFIQLSQINLIASITGCLIPDFLDMNNTDQFIQTLVNNTTGYTGLFCAVNQLALDNITYVAGVQTGNSSLVDLIGDNLINAMTEIPPQTSINFLSYKAPLTNDYTYDEFSPSYFTAGFGSPAFDVLIATLTTPLYQDYIKGVITDGDQMFYNGVGGYYYLKFTPGSNVSYQVTITNPLGLYVEIAAYDSLAFTGQHNIPAAGATYSSLGAAVLTGWDIFAFYGSHNKDIPYIVDPASNGNKVLISAANAVHISVGDLLVDSTGQHLTYILSMAKFNIGGDVLITCVSPILFNAGFIEQFKTIQEFATEFNFAYLQGFTLKDTAIPNGTDLRMNAILDVMTNTNIATTLAQKDLITFRYIVDTFNGDLQPQSKSRLASIAMARGTCMAIVNTPSMLQFQNSTNPVFTDAPTPSQPAPQLDTKYIATGGNLNLNPSYTYSLVNETNGSKYVGYFAPNIILRDNGKNISIPPAAHVSNLFVQKFINGTPFAIVAGPRRGSISDINLVGVEYDFDHQDRDNLEPFGINPIIRQKGQGVMIFANNTGYQTVNSAFNNLHVRDLLITVEDDIETILNNYLYEFNDPSTRLEIKTKVDNYLEGVQSAGGIYNYTTIMDTSNNTPDIIDQNFGIIDVILEPARGIQKFINRITITRTGAVASGGFTIA